MATISGTLYLLGGEEAGNLEIGQELLRGRTGVDLAVLPTASAFMEPERAVLEIGEWLRPLGADVEGLMVSSRSDAELDEFAQRLQSAEIGYLTDGSAMHLRTTLKATAVFDALIAMIERGATVVASGSAASVLCDPMIDPRGGAPTVGLGPIRAFTVVPHREDDEDASEEKLLRTLQLLPNSQPALVLDAGAGVICHADGTYGAIGKGEVRVFRDAALVPEGLKSLGPWREPPS